MLQGSPQYHFLFEIFLEIPVSINTFFLWTTKYLIIFFSLMEFLMYFLKTYHCLYSFHIRLQSRDYVLFRKSIYLAQVLHMESFWEISNEWMKYN